MMIHRLLVAWAHIHPFLVLLGLILPFVFIKRLKRRHLSLSLFSRLAGALVLMAFLYQGLSWLLLDQNHVGIRQFIVLAIPFTVLFLSERSDTRDRLMKVTCVLIVALFVSQIVLVRSKLMTGDARATDTREEKLRNICYFNLQKTNTLKDREKLYERQKLTRIPPSVLWKDVRDSSTDIIDSDLVRQVVVLRGWPAWHSFLTGLYWFKRETRYLCWSGGKVDDGWFYVDGETPEQGKVRWEAMLDEQFPLGRPDKDDSGPGGDMGPTSQQGTDELTVLPDPLAQ